MDLSLKPEDRLDDYVLRFERLSQRLFGIEASMKLLSKLFINGVRPSKAKAEIQRYWQNFGNDDNQRTNLTKKVLEVLNKSQIIYEASAAPQPLTASRPADNTRFKKRASESKPTVAAASSSNNPSSNTPPTVCPHCKKGKHWKSTCPEAECSTFHQKGHWAYQCPNSTCEPRATQHVFEAVQSLWLGIVIKATNFGQPRKRAVWPLVPHASQVLFGHW